MACIIEFPLVQYHQINSSVAIEKRTLIARAQSILKKLGLALQKLGNYPIIQCNNQMRSPLRLFFTIKLTKLLEIVVNISLNMVEKTYQIYVALSNGSQFITTKSSEILKNICKTIKSINSMIPHSSVFFTLHPHNGQIIIKSHLHFSSTRDPDSTILFLQLLTNESVKFAKTFAIVILYCSNQVPSSLLKTQLPDSLKGLFFGPGGQFMRFADIQELLPLTNCGLQLDQYPSKNNKNNLMDGSVNCKKIIDIYYKQRQYSKQACLYNQSSIFVPQTPINQHFGKQAFAKFLSSPTARESQTDNPYIFNTITVTGSDRAKQKMIGEGGKARIVALQLKFTYTKSMNVIESSLCKEKESMQQSTEETDEPQNKKLPFQFEKIMVVKVPKATQNETIRRKFADQIRYEKEILANLRGAVTGYLPKYYHSVQTNFEYRNYLLMDYIQGPTLADELILKKSTLTHSSNMHILIHISNAIRFLQKYDVAHLDLSPSNILVVKDNLIKLIDFGQAYHPATSKKFKQVNSNKYIYSPGRTFPYAPPETSQRIQNFNSQQDVFSLGVIIFKMLMGYSPLSCSLSAYEKLYQEKSYMNRIFFAPEQVESLGQKNFMEVLVNIIFKLMSVDENLRPLPVWTHILLKKLFMTLR